MEESENENRVVIFLGNGDQVEVVMLVEVEKVVIFVFY
jgi:hypothetical protein